jgi:hypothetical protein
LPETFPNKTQVLIFYGAAVENDVINAEFWARADAAIDLANKQCESAPNGKVSSSLLYGAARFNAFIVAVKASDLEELKSDREEAVRYFTEQYRIMFEENLDDYIENYDNYIKRSNK